MHYNKKIIFMMVALLALNSNAFSNDMAMNVKRAAIKKTIDEQKLKKVTGVITDEKGVPVAGATVAVQGTTNAVLTDMDGGFTIEAPEDSVLVISYIGFTTQTVPVKGKTSINVKLAQGIKNLDEVIVTGYASQAKKNITGSVVTMKVSDDLRMAATTSAGNLLQGRLAGVVVGSTSGVPGSQPSISIRKNSSSTSQPVLYVIDGIVKGSGDFNNLSPNEIETMTVLKDAAAASIYGARSAGGVILVTTKRGEAGKMRIDYSYSYGQDSRTKSADRTSAVELGLLSNRMVPVGDWRYHTPEDLAYLQTINNGWGYDQLDEIWTNPTLKTQNFSVSGGSDKVKYFAGLSNVKQTTFVKAYGYNKTNARFNTTANITKDLQFFAGIGFQEQDTDTDTFEGPEAAYRKLNVWQPWQPVYTKGGQYIDYGWIANVGAESNREGGYTKTNNFKPDVNINLSYKIPGVEGLKVKASYAKSWVNNHYRAYRKFYSMAVMPMNATGRIISTDDSQILRYKNNTSISFPSLRKNASWADDHQINFQANYDHNFGKHSVQGVLGYEAAEAENDGVNGYREKVPLYLTDQWWAFSGSRADTDAGGPNSAKTGRKSVYGQANYSYDGKYLATFVFREDGSMNFAKTERWGFFPSVSVGWVLSEENFFSNLKDHVQRVKLRASGGLTGNDRVGTGLEYQWQQTFALGSTAYFGETPAPSPGVRYGSIVNPNLTWEKTKDYNVGIDIDFLKHWNTTFEYYWRDTYDILAPRIASVPTSFSRTLPQENYGEIKAQGFDFSLGYRNSWNKLNYYATLTVNRGSNKVITQDYATNALPINIPVGKSLDRIVGFETEPIIRTQADLNAFNAAHPGYKVDGWVPFLGMLPIKDISGPTGKPDNIIDDYDKVDLVKDNTPTNYGLNFGGDFKGFSLDVVFSGSTGSVKSWQEINGGVEWNRMYKGWYDDSWTPENPNATLPKIWAQEGANSTTNKLSNYWLKKNDYIRLSYLNFGYDFAELSHIKGINNLKLYATGSNLFVLGNFTKYWDPQGSAFSYPIMKSFSIGLNVGF
ncbi:SusC/RagA family TonB-linked outer membrane protein [Flavobacterium gilvum]|uniref:TonB-dependent receptor plug domain-containing protein n=1 Tax=Flavobacterium gilvum TaxID=1492737 RepID=A0AAC9N603_9FLAO|nr:SusC/RagA family TonB-linked outer membrane protein [Flavobacterium gilvum]AOW10556.1 hypothetical protein EM308_14205 [Flavobacterium gilvum]KFC59574.1 hypothetical protein FEM08_16230 [Flavobacterium gilvum]